MTRSTVVHLVDQDCEGRREPVRILEACGYAVRTFASASDFLARGLEARPDCIVIETALECGGLEFQERIRERDAAATIVFVTRDCDVRFVVRAMRAGAVDLLQKPVDESSFLDAVSRAVAKSAALRTQRALRDNGLERLARLTPREREIFDQLLQGRLSKQIAATLDCQEATVKVHRSRLMRKLGLRSLARLTRFGQEIGCA